MRAPTRPWTKRAMPCFAKIAAFGFVVSAALTVQSFAYDRNDAQYVTTSKSGAVLDYVVCLESAVANTPRRTELVTALDQAEVKCKVKAAKLPQSTTEPDTSDLRSMIMECGFRPGDASPDAGCEGVVETSKPPIAANSPPPPRDLGRYNPSQAEEKVIADGVRARLKDPSSAVFGGMVAIRDKNGFLYVCGSVNAKNSYGGFTGHQPYYGMLAGDPPHAAFAVVGIGGTDTERNAILKVCRDRGLL